MKGSEEWVIQKQIAENYGELAMAIVEQAAKDLKRYIRVAQRAMSHDGQPAPVTLWRILKLKQFFVSDWYKTLCSLDGEVIIEGIEREMGWSYDPSEEEIQSLEAKSYQED